MAKYIDMEVLSDIKIDKVDQTTLTLKTGSKISLQIPDVTADNVGVRVENGQLQFGDGTSWVGAPVPNQEITVEGEPIVFSSSDLDSEGKLTIQHNLGKYPFGLNYTLMPKDISFPDMNTIVFDFSDRSTITSGHIWFNGSQQSMLVQPAPTPEWMLSGAGIPEVNGNYAEVPSDQYAEYLGEGMSTTNSICMWTNGTHILYGYNNGVDILTVVPKGWVNTETPLYHYPGISNFDDLTTVSFITVGGTAPAPTISHYTEG